MNFKDYKYEIIIGASLAILFSSLFAHILRWTPKKSGFLNNVSFEMARPQSDFRSEFSLEGREIDKEFVNPFKKKEAVQSNNKTDKQPGKLVPIKKQEVKKEQAKADKKIDKKGFKVNVVERSNSQGLSPSDYDHSYNPYRTNNISGGGGVINNIKPDAKLEEENKKTAKDFADLATKPTQEKVKEFILAFKNGEISSAEFAQVVAAMLDSENPNAQSMAVYISYSFPNVTTFSLVTLSLDHLNEQVKTYANEFLFSFNHQAKIQYLGQALQSNDIKIVTKAGEVIILGLQKVKNGQNIVYAGREGRGNNDINSTKFFAFLLPIAETLKKSQNQTVASVGNALSQEIGATATN